MLLTSNKQSSLLHPFYVPSLFRHFSLDKDLGYELSEQGAQWEMKGNVLLVGEKLDFWLLIKTSLEIIKTEKKHGAIIKHDD